MGDNESIVGHESPCSAAMARLVELAAACSRRPQCRSVFGGGGNAAPNQTLVQYLGQWHRHSTRMAIVLEPVKGPAKPRWISKRQCDVNVSPDAVLYVYAPGSVLTEQPAGFRGLTSRLAPHRGHLLDAEGLDVLASTDTATRNPTLGPAYPRRASRLRAAHRQRTGKIPQHPPRLTWTSPTLGPCGSTRSLRR